MKHDARDIQAVLMKHPKARRISGYCFNGAFLLFVVVEIDLPYKNSQVADYGDNFAAWGEEDFSAFISSLTAALPLSPLTLVVSIVICFTLSGTSF